MGQSARSLALVVLAGGGALAGVPLGFAQGDGSRTDNPDLLRGSLGVGCPAGTLCDFPAERLLARPILPANALASTPAPLATVAPAEVPSVAPPATPAPAPVPAEPAPVSTPVASSDHADLAYGISLRGAYVRSEGGERFEMLAIPSIGFSRSVRAADVTLDASATLVQPRSDDPRIADAEVAFDTEYRLSPSADLAFNADFALSQDDPQALTVDTADLITAPLIVSGGLGAAYTQTFGRLDATVSLGLDREWVGSSTRSDGIEIDNDDESYTHYEGGLRLGYAVTPVLEIFGQGTAGRTDFDGADPDLGLNRNGADYTLRGGIAGNWNDVLVAELSLGSGWRDYDAGRLADAQSWLYGAVLGYRFNPTTQIVASLETELTPGEDGGGASTRYLAGLEASHTANSWLGLRASAGLEWLAPDDETAASRLYSAGIGADVLIGPHTSATLDYEYGLREDPGAADARRDEHRVSGGISLQY